MRRAGSLLLLLLLVGCEPAWEWTGLPAGLEPPRVPEDNPMTLDKVELGERLFFDEALSSSGEMSCATCHLPERAFTEDRAVSLGQGGEAHSFNAPTLVNTGFLASYGWANDVLRTLERHAPVPLFGEAPVEIGLDDEGLAYLEAEYGADLEDLVHALASYQRTLIDFDSRWDRGELDALEREGERVFADKGCVGCHVPPLFTNAGFSPGAPLRFEDNGITSEDPGLMAVSLDEADRGHFKVPTLRNVGLTSPYLHDGRFATLESLLDAYDEARALQLDDDEKTALLAFLRAL